MRIHHLNCGMHRTLGGALLDGVSRGPFADIVTHCLLIETAGGLVLVDSGYGLQDVRNRHDRLAFLWPTLLNVQLRESLTALRQIEALGFSADDVRHIVLTHLDFDHAGGIEDFPQARIHVLAAEREAAGGKRRGLVATQRYRPRQFDGVREWRTYAGGGEPWFGFDAVRDLDGLPPEILLVPLSGHTLGHAGVAVRTKDRWLLHAGDAFMHHGEMKGETPWCPAGLRLYQAIMQADAPSRAANRDRLHALQSTRNSEIRIFCSHDSHDFCSLRNESMQAAETIGGLHRYGSSSVSQ